MFQSMTNNFPNLMRDIDWGSQGNEPILSMISYNVSKRPRSRYMRMQMLKVNDREEILKAAAEEKTYKGFR